MKHKVLNTLKAHNMLQKGDKVIVALSGGADSVTLLDLLISLKDELNIEVYAAHVNHNLRGDESVRDEAFVKELCKKHNVELFVRSVDVNALCTESSEGFETMGRRVRYEFFEELSEKHDAVIATAHTLSDSLETALLNIARGTSFSGVSSIPYKRSRVIRPLLDVTREEVEEYTLKNSLSYVNDTTNFDADICNRNKVRHKIVPVLKEVNDGVLQNFGKLRQSVIEADSFINEEAQKVLIKAKTDFGYNANILSGTHTALLNYSLRLILENAGAGFENIHIELIKASLSEGGAVSLTGGYTAIVSQGILRITKAISIEKGSFPFEINAVFSYNGKKYSVKELTQEEIVYRKLALNVISCDKINSDALFRTRQSGDRFELIKRGITKDLRKLQNELKIPSEKRDEALLLWSQGKILWAENIGVSADGMYKKGNGIFIEVEKEQIYA